MKNEKPPVELSTIDPRFRPRGANFDADAFDRNYPGTSIRLPKAVLGEELVIYRAPEVRPAVRPKPVAPWPPEAA